MFKCLIEEISGYRYLFKEKYCVLFFFVFFNNNFCVNDFLENNLFENKYKYVLKFCGIDKNISFDIFEYNFDFLKGFMVRKIGDKY